MEDIHLERKENNIPDVEKSLEKSNAQKKAPSENNTAV